MCCVCSSRHLTPCNSCLPKKTPAFGRVPAACRYKVLAQQTKEDARCAFMRILRTLPYGNATFFAVRRIGECCSSSRRSARQQTSLPALLVGRLVPVSPCLMEGASADVSVTSHPAACCWLLAVHAAEDPIGLLPPRLILGINKRGVHFFRPVPKEYLHSAELRDIMQVCCSCSCAGGSVACCTQTIALWTTPAPPALDSPTLGGFQRPHAFGGGVP